MSTDDFAAAVEEVCCSEAKRKCLLLAENGAIDPIAMCGATNTTVQLDL
jgi:hypothetical protein